MPETCLKIYLAGPLSGCNEHQRTRWRNDFKNLFPNKFEFIDPAKWGKDWNPALEMKAVEESAVTVANMWKESIGTTIGIVRARMSGKPVILVDPNYLFSSILKGLVSPEVPVHSLQDAKRRLMEIVKGFRPGTRVKKVRGSDEAFSRRRLVRSISIACDNAELRDGIYQSLIVAAVSQRLQALAASGEIASPVIRDTIFSVLADFATNPVYPPDVKQAVLQVKTKWVEREEYKGVDQLYKEVVDKNTQLTAQVDQLTLALVEARRTNPATVAEPQPPEPAPTNLLEVVDAANERFRGRLIFSKSARDSAADSPYVHLEAAMNALGALADCAHARQEQLNGRGKPVGIHQWFEKNKARYPGLRFVPHEGKHTMNKHDAERTFEHGGREWIGEMHLRLGSGKPTDCLRIHFACDSDTCVFVVGHIGRHLRTVSRSE